MKLLLLDIEAAPSTVHVWGLFKQTVSINQIMASGYVLCFSAQWLGEPKVYFNSVHQSTPVEMLTEIHGLLNEADAVVTYNGKSYDVPTLQREFFTHGLLPPAPFAQIDLLQIVRNQFKFQSNKLDYVCKVLGLGSKVSHKGHELWIKCMAGDASAWRIMKKYNIQDVKLLGALYERLLPWITAHPHVGLYAGNPSACPNCGGMNLESRGLAYTKLSSYRRFRCNDCGTWTRSSKREAGVTRQYVN